MAVNQVSMNGEELINLTNDTVSELSLLSGATAHDASGEQIVGKAQYINPNLIINGSLKINQRRQTEYVGNTQNAIYSLDMWKLLGTVEVREDYITISPENSAYGYGVYSQMVSADNEGKPFTLSARINDELVYISGICSAEYIGLARDGWNMRFTSLNAEQISVEFIVDTKIKVARVKLEPGLIPTPYVDPDEALELVKCQRYFRTISRGVHVKYAGTNGSDVVIRVPFEMPMRTIPTVFVMNHKAILTYCNGWVDEPTELSIINVNVTQYGIAYLHVNGFNLSGLNLQPGQNLTLATDNVFGISAEL